MPLVKLTCEEQTDQLIHVCDPCNTEELGRVRSVLLCEADYDFAPLIAALKGTQTTQTAAQILDAAVAAGKIHIIPETTGTVAEDPQTGDGYGDEESRLLGYQYTVNYHDPSYTGNRDFYQAAEHKKLKVVYRTETLLHFPDKAANIQATDPVETDLTSKVDWNVNAIWKSKNKPILAPSAALDEYFQACYEHQDEPAPGA